MIKFNIRSLTSLIWLLIINYYFSVKFIYGGCETSSCGEEAACVQYNTTVHYCVCTSNAEPAKEGVKCPRSTGTNNLYCEQLFKMMLYF